jgi:hypothetical protein
MASPASRRTPLMCSFVKRLLDVQTSFSKGAFGDSYVPQVTPLPCAGDRHVILPPEESPLGAAQRILFEEVRARRLCGTNGLRLREGCLEHVSPHGRHRFQMHAIPERLNPPGKPIHGDGDGRSSPIAQTGWHPFPGIHHQYLCSQSMARLHSLLSRKD